MATQTPGKTQWFRRCVVAGTVGVVALLVLSTHDRSDGPDHETAPGSGFESRGGAASFRLVYRVETGDGHQVTSEERLVRRPFEGQLVGSTEAPSASLRPSGTMTTATGVFLVNESGVATEVAGRVHGPPTGDFGFLAALDHLVEEGVMVDQGTTDEIVGRRCRIYRTLEPPSISFSAPTAKSYDELCVDSAGVVLRERWVADGDLLLIREAVDFDDSPSDQLLSVFDDAADEGKSPPEPMESRGEHDGFLQAPPRPPGFTDAGRYEFVPELQSATASGRIYRSIYWVYTRGIDYVVVESGTGAAPFSLEEGRGVEIPGLGTAHLLVGEQGPEARVSVGSSQWLRIRASAPMAWIESYLPSLSVGD